MEDVGEDDNSAELRRAIRDSDSANCVDIVNESIADSDTYVELGNQNSACGLTKVKRSHGVVYEGESWTKIETVQTNGRYEGESWTKIETVQTNGR